MGTPTGARWRSPKALRSASMRGSSPSAGSTARSGDRPPCGHRPGATARPRRRAAWSLKRSPQPAPAARGPRGRPRSGPDNRLRQGVLRLLDLTPVVRPRRPSPTSGPRNASIRDRGRRRSSRWTGSGLRRRPGGIRVVSGSVATAPIPAGPGFSAILGSSGAGRDRHVAGSLEREPLGARDRILHSRARLDAPERDPLHPRRSGARGVPRGACCESSARPPRASRSRETTSGPAPDRRWFRRDPVPSGRRGLQHRRAPAARPTCPGSASRCTGSPPRGARVGRASVGNHGHSKRRPAGHHGQADAVDGHAALVEEVPLEALGHLEDELGPRPRVAALEPPGHRGRSVAAGRSPTRRARSD